MQYVCNSDPQVQGFIAIFRTFWFEPCVLVIVVKCLDRQTDGHIDGHGLKSLKTDKP